MTADPTRVIADAVLYEGYILWPYRRSALKNQRRFTFGGVYPPRHSARHPDDPSRMQTQVLIRGSAASTLRVEARFLQVVQRSVLRRDGDRLTAVDELAVDGRLFVAWEEATERQAEVPPVSLAELHAGRRVAIQIDAGQERESVTDAGGDCAAALERTWRSLSGRLDVGAVRLVDELWRVTAEVRNTTEFDGGSRQLALGQTLCSTHTMLRAGAGEFVSLTDPPPDVASAAQECVNLGTWPVLVGATGDRSTILSSPIILEDYPRIAPQSPGDLFDGGEIDELLLLNILALTDAEKAEMAACDPRAREILERTEALTPAQLDALHGTVREVGTMRP